MLKSVIKEIGIMVLILVAIVLILAIVLYDYNPNSKTIPKQAQQYEISAEVQDELSKAVTSNIQNIVKTYVIDEQDLKTYEKNNEYDSGKVNPFKTWDNNTVQEKNETTGILNTIGK